MAVANHGDKVIIARGKVEGVSVDAFRDPGCTTVLAKDILVPKGKFTGRVVDLRMANNRVFTYPEAHIYFDTPFFTGNLLSVCLPDPIYELVIEGSTDRGRSVQVSAEERGRKGCARSSNYKKLKEALSTRPVLNFLICLKSSCCKLTRQR